MKDQNTRSQGKLREMEKNESGTERAARLKAEIEDKEQIFKGREL